MCLAPVLRAEGPRESLAQALAWVFRFIAGSPEGASVEETPRNQRSKRILDLGRRGKARRLPTSAGEPVRFDYPLYPQRVRLSGVSKASRLTTQAGSLRARLEKAKDPVGQMRPEWNRVFVRREIQSPVG